MGNNPTSFSHYRPSLLKRKYIPQSFNSSSSPLNLYLYSSSSSPLQNIRQSSPSQSAERKDSLILSFHISKMGNTDSSEEEHSSFPFREGNTIEEKIYLESLNDIVTHQPLKERILRNHSSQQKKSDRKKKREIGVNISDIKLFYRIDKQRLKFTLAHILKESSLIDIKAGRRKIIFLRAHKLTLNYNGYKFEVLRIGIKTVNIKVIETKFHQIEYDENITFSKKNILDDACFFYKEMIEKSEDPYLILLTKIRACLYYCDYIEYMPSLSAVTILDLMIFHQMNLLFGIPYPTREVVFHIDDNNFFYKNPELKVLLPSYGDECLGYDFNGQYQQILETSIPTK